MNVPNPLSGGNPLVSWLNQLRAVVFANVLKPGLGYKVKRGTDGTVLEIDVGKGGTSAAISGPYKIKSVQGDYLTCCTWDGTTEGSTDIYIAKQFKLRNSITSETIGGTVVSYSYTNTQTRVASATISNVAYQETQLVTPDYLTNDIIWAQTCTTLVSRNNVDLTLIEMDEGRAWAHDPSQD